MPGRPQWRVGVIASLGWPSVIGMQMASDAVPVPVVKDF
jgi:hypothetical protein